jgi:hypothetical protein
VVASPSVTGAARGGISRRGVLRAAILGAGAVAVGGLRAPAWAAPASATAARFRDLDGVPLHYWRWRDGTAGRRTEHRTFTSTVAFHERLVVWKRDLQDLAARFGGLTGMDRIVTAGTFVDKPGQHGLGQAFDLDQVRWANGAVTPYWREHASGSRTVVRRYLAVDAVCRRHFRWVLDGRYNAAHADHLHLDFGGGTVRLDRSSRSETVFVQQMLNAHQGAGLAVDGKWGGRTQAAFDESRRRLGVGGEPWANAPSWRAWLFRAASCGFADRPFEAPPGDHADPLRDVLAELDRTLEPLLGDLDDQLLEALGLLDP